MSQWTHVAAVIVVDRLNPIHYGGLLEEGIPTGSEGPINWRVVPGTGILQGGGDYGLKRYDVVYIVGDLRDYDQAPPLLDWFSGVLSRLKTQAVVRDAVIHIDVESRFDMTGFWDGDVLKVLPAIPKASLKGAEVSR